MTVVLVADDEPTITAFLQEVLEDEGYTVRTAYGAAVLLLVQEEPPSLILLDVNMPGMDGIQIVNHLRADSRTAEIPIVLMSAMRHLHARTQDLAVDRVLTKPFDLVTLLTCVAELAGPPSPHNG